jgi:hypothetical protein
MAMTDCKECGKQISTTATSCPHCGHKPEKDKLGCAQVIVIALLAIVVTAVVVTCASPSTSTSKPPADPAKQQRFNEEVGALLYIKRNMKNPASFELVDFIRTPANSLCIVYRGTNSFNAITTQRHVINDNTNSNSDEAWNSHCAGRSGEDVSKAKYALP